MQLRVESKELLDALVALKAIALVTLLSWYN